MFPPSQGSSAQTPPVARTHAPRQTGAKRPGVLHKLLRATLAAKPYAVLCARAQLPGPLQPLWHKRLATYDDHVAQVTCKDAWMWAGQALKKPLRALRKPYTRTLFPIAKMAFHNALAMEMDIVGDAGPNDVPDGCAFEPFALFNGQHDLLDALRIATRPAATSSKDWPTVLFVPPNGMLMEELLVPACAFAKRYQSDVIMFNYRGVGKSMGSLCSIADAVNDTAAGILFALNESRHVGVLGLSMGGGCAAAALSTLQNEQRIAPDAVSLFVAIHTFTSWYDVYAGRLGAFQARRFFLGMRLLGMTDLTTHARAKTCQLARTVMIAEAVEEQVIPAQARLGFVNPKIPRSEVFFDIGRKHGDLMVFPLTPGPQDNALSLRLTRWHSALKLTCERPST